MGGLPLQNASPASVVSQVSVITNSTKESKPKKKICCACPETKKLRDECMVEHGELHVQNGLRLINSAFVLRALTFEFGRYGLVHKSIPFWNIE
ncbi:cytochrome oxidase copper chaperone-related family protein [Salix suchowensis]|nr:cytochrome oxidase copper chaperone-related family protein [Salix suchowensis]